MDPTICRIDSRGRITIPKAIRDISGIKAGDYVTIRAEYKKIIITKVEF